MSSALESPSLSLDTGDECFNEFSLEDFELDEEVDSNELVDYDIAREVDSNDVDADSRDNVLQDMVLIREFLEERHNEEQNIYTLPADILDSTTHNDATVSYTHLTLPTNVAV